MPKLTFENFLQNQKDWEDLNDLFARNELDMNNRAMLNQETKEAWRPCPWIDALSRVPQLKGFAEMLSPVEPRELAPMTDRMRKLCRRLGLPEYVGETIGVNPQTEPEDAPRPQNEEMPRKRCPACGSWMYPISWLQLKQLGALPAGQSLDLESQLTCEACGAVEEEDGKLP